MNERNRTSGTRTRHARLTRVQIRGKILPSTALDRRHEPLNGELKLRGNEGILADLE